ncbi:MAG: hypothetical protein MI725_08895 [Pirellulales bacterium]|nr:hypothetical protein [Pirellulales bacterium]
MFRLPSEAAKNHERFVTERTVECSFGKRAIFEPRWNNATTSEAPLLLCGEILFAEQQYSLTVVARQ